MNADPYPRLLPAGDSALTVRFGDRIEPEIHDRVLSFAERVDESRLPGVIEVVPTYCSATVYLHPFSVDPDILAIQLLSLAGQPPSRSRTGRKIEVPVCYGGAFGPDLADVAAFAGRSIEAVIHLHSSIEYRCYMLGFSPGFPYLGAVPEAIAMPRRAEPRLQVPAGSVGIAGLQTGIYPQQSPGGWRLIGRTPLRIFDLHRGDPFLIQPGDQVRFVPIEREQFDESPNR
jgi:inhibitor of KinA